jgi:CheY-like chemotaxis protein
MNIVVVDDEPDVKALFEQRFRREIRLKQMVLHFAFSGEEALKLLAHRGVADIVLILSDINMPGMTGLEMLPKVKEIRPEVPVIMITAYGDADTKRKALENGASGLLTKPIDFSLLREEIDTRVAAAN